MKKCKKILFAILFWVISLTWGALTTIPGLLITLVAICCGGKPHKNGCSYIVEIGGNWGGLELGAVALCGSYSKDTSLTSWYHHTRKHEFGHAIQNLIFGPLFVFIIGIPSAIRYWYEIIIEKIKNVRFSNYWYESIWFEKTATNWGTYWIDKLESYPSYLNKTKKLDKSNKK